MKDENKKSKNFISKIVDEHNASGRFDGIVKTRFPPEPNGFMHIGHVKATHIDFGIAQAYGGDCNLRFDDTNPTKEETKYIDAMIRDLKWLGFDWGDNLFFASDYFGQLYDYAVQLIKKGSAYVDDLSPTEVRAYRGTLTEPGKNSPWRDRSIEENLRLFEQMRDGAFEEGTHILRAKIDMASPNINLRDPAMYRILNTPHHRTGDKWHVYPMYDWAHGLSDSIEGVTHSLCTLEFESHRPLYDWYLDQLGLFHPQQIEFARLNVTHTITSKRKLRQLVENSYVSGWDDPRMPTVSGMRRAGYPASALRAFIEATGVARSHNLTEVEMLEHFVRDVLNKKAPRAMAVLHPLRLIVDNYPEDKSETFDLPIYLQDRSRTESRKVTFSRELFIEQDDFAEVPPPKFKRMIPGRIIRLLGAYLVKCTSVDKDESGVVTAVHCDYFPETKGGSAVPGIKPKGTIHWASAEHSHPAEVRLYGRLFTKANPARLEDGETFLDILNDQSLTVLKDARVELNLASAESGDQFQFMRTGYFVVDNVDSTPDHLVFNRTVSLRGSWKPPQ